MDQTENGYRRVPGLYRLWDLPAVLPRTGDWRIHYVELTEEGTPLFALHERVQGDDKP